MTLRIAAVACIATLVGSPAVAQRVCTLQVRPVGPMSTELIERAIKETLQVQIGTRLLPADYETSTKTFSVNLGSSAPTRDALARSTPVLEGFEFQRVDNSEQLDNSQTGCTASYSFRPIKVWKVQVSAPTLVLLDITEPSGQLHVPTPRLLPTGQPVEWTAKIEFQVHPILEAKEYVYTVTLHPSDFGKTACNQTRPDYFCHDAAKIRESIFAALPRGNSMAQTIRMLAAQETIKKMTIPPRIDFELRKP
jgi:hypothetical protein